MPIFEDVSKSMAKEVGDKEMMHVKCVDHATSMKLYSFLLEEDGLSVFWKKKDKPLEFTLFDILEKTSSPPEPEVNGPHTFSDTLSRKLKIGMTVDAVADANVGVAATKFQESSLQYQFVGVSRQKLEELRKWKLLVPEPSYLQQYRNSQANLYVVTKTVQLLNSPVLSDIRSGSFLGSFSFLANPATKAKGEGEGQASREKMLTLKKGMVMAYKKMLLVFENDGWRFHDITNDKQKSFPEFFSSRSLGRLEEPSGQNFKCLENEIVEKVRNVVWLSRNVPRVMFVNIQAMLGDQQALQDLMDMLQQGKTSCHSNGPGATILSELGRIPEYPHVAPVELILYLLDAVMVLNDTQHALLAWSMERRILLHQWNVVRSILEPNFKYPWSIPFTLAPQLLAPLQGEGVAVTYGLLQECGLRVEPSNPRSTWDLDAKEPLSALLAALTILHWMAEA